MIGVAIDLDGEHERIVATVDDQEIDMRQAMVGIGDLALGEAGFVGREQIYRIAAQ